MTINYNIKKHVQLNNFYEICFTFFFSSEILRYNVLP